MKLSIPKSEEEFQKLKDKLFEETKNALAQNKTPIFKNGTCVYNSPSTEEIREYCKAELSSMWDEVLRFENPHGYYVDLSQKLWDMRSELLSSHSK